MLLNEKKKKETKKIVLLAAVILIVIIVGVNTGNNLKYNKWETININNRFTINVPGKLNEKKVEVPNGYEFIKEHKIFTIEKHDISVRVCYTLYNNNVQRNLSSLYDMTNSFANNSNVIKNYKATEKEIIINPLTGVVFYMHIHCIILNSFSHLNHFSSMS